MAELLTIARPYAQALFEVVSINRDQLPECLEELRDMAALSQLPEVREMMADPRFDQEKRVELFMALVPQGLSEQLHHFVLLLIDNDRFQLLPEILVHFETLKNQAEGSHACDIVSAFELSSEQLSELTAMLEKKFGYKLKPQVTIDPSVIGGVRVTVGDQVLDTSVQGQLARLRETLTAS